MKRKSISLVVIATFAASITVFAEPATLRNAKVTEVHNDVRLQEESQQVSSSTADPSPYRNPAKAVTRPAVAGDVVKGGRMLATGKSSRAELLFNDNTIARLGSNSLFTFRPESRNVHLSSGFILLHTPQGKGGATVTTPTASAAVLGTTIMLSVLPDGSVKLVVLEGIGTLTFQGQTVTLLAGQLCIYTPGQGISQPSTIDLKKLTETSSMLGGFQGKLGSEDLIQQAIEAQLKQLSNGELQITGDEKGLKYVPDSGFESAIEAMRAKPQSSPPPSPPSGGGEQGPR
jgi:hypothetical protein